MKNFIKTFKSLFLIGLLFGGQEGRGATCEASLFEQWLEELTQEAYSLGVSEKTLEKAKPYLVTNPKAKKLDQKQATTVVPFEDYYKFATPHVLKGWVKAVKKQKILLEKIGKKYGVAPSYIAAIWAMESRCGHVMGNFNVLTSLTTLSYEGRRRAFFRKELLTALRLVEKFSWEPETLVGSWAGAMGQCQFMPTSFEKYAVDEDLDGWANIWGSLPDVFASIAHYLKGYGWKWGAEWGQEVKVSSELYQKVQETPEAYGGERSLQEWKSLGVKIKKGGLPSQKASLICPVSRKKKAYLVYKNFNVIKEYNKSVYYALSVGILADYFKQKCWSSKTKKDE